MTQSVKVVLFLREERFKSGGTARAKALLSNGRVVSWRGGRWQLEASTCGRKFRKIARANPRRVIRGNNIRLTGCEV